MVTVSVYSSAGQKTGDMDLSAEVFGLEPNEALLHQAVVTTLANMRQGTADTKTRAEVKHTTRKVWRQKGTGRARQGMRSAPHWKGGGIAFGPHPRDYSLSFPKKMRRKAVLNALSVKMAADAIVVVEDFGITEGKTKQAVALLDALNIADFKKLLIVLDEPTDEQIRSFRNLPNVVLVTCETLGTYDILLADRLVFSRAGIEALQEMKLQPVGAARLMAEGQGGA